MFKDHKVRFVSFVTAATFFGAHQFVPAAEQGMGYTRPPIAEVSMPAGVFLHGTVLKHWQEPICAAFSCEIKV
jgi:hypothetical protein